MQRRQTIVVEGCLWIWDRMGMRRGWLFRRRGGSARRNRDRHAACHGVEAVDLAAQQRGRKECEACASSRRQRSLVADNGRLECRRGAFRGEKRGGSVRSKSHWPESRLSISLHLSHRFHPPSSSHHPIVSCDNSAMSRKSLQLSGWKVQGLFCS